MATRFCSQCGVPAVPEARFCHACGTPVAGRAAARAARAGRRSPIGYYALGFFLLAGLGIWAAILSPPPPPSGPGAAGPRAAASAAPAQTELPPGHPQVPMQLPEDVKQFIASVAEKAKENPDDPAAWLRLAGVYARAGKLDPAYVPDARQAYARVLELDENNAEALRGIANIHYDRNEHRQAIPYYERFLSLHPDDPGARTDLGTMYLYAGDTERAVAAYREVLRRDPSFLQAHYNLAIAYHGQGDTKAALAELETARGLADDKAVTDQIDEMIATLTGAPGRPAPAPDGDRSPFQSTVEAELRKLNIVGPRVVRVEWTGPGTGRALLADFPMEGMPEAVRQKFLGNVGDLLRDARDANQVAGPVRLDLADVASGTVMATATP